MRWPPKKTFFLILHFYKVNTGVFLVHFFGERKLLSSSKYKTRVFYLLLFEKSFYSQHVFFLFRTLFFHPCVLFPTCYFLFQSLFSTHVFYSQHTLYWIFQPGGCVTPFLAIFFWKNERIGKAQSGFNWAPKCYILSQ